MSKRPLATAFGVSALIAILAALALLLTGDRAGRPLFSGGKVGVVFIQGAITQSIPTLQALDKLKRDKSIKAILLRVDSPGGGLGPSQEIYAEILRVKKTKPVVCSMGGVAASGGYYVAAPCTKIMANPGTITGSIGVISTIPDLQGLFNKIGVKVQIVQAGRLKASGAPSKPLSPAERAMLQGAMDDAHRQFISDVANARRMKFEMVRALADGGIFTGKRAKDLGLVDELGNFTRAAKLAARLGGIKGEPELVLPEKDKAGFLRRLLRNEGRALIKELTGQWGNGGLSALYVPGGTAP